MGYEIIIYLLFGMIIFLIFLMIYVMKSVENNMAKEYKQTNAISSIKNELKMIKNDFDSIGEFKYDRMIDTMILLVIIIIFSMLFIKDYIENPQYFQYRFISSFAIFIILIVLAIINMYSLVKGIQVDNYNLIIKKVFSKKEYEIHNLEEIKIKIKIGNKGRRVPYLFLKNEDDDEHIKYSLQNYFNVQKVIALAIFINLIKQNKLNTIDTITEKGILELEDEIII